MTASIITLSSSDAVAVEELLLLHLTPTWCFCQQVGITGFEASLLSVTVLDIFQTDVTSGRFKIVHGNWSDSHCNQPDT